jgi:two-component system, chemotaxis family, CheB/CheR fusion protein
VTSSTRTSPERSDAAGLESLLQYLKSNRGFDFSGYKRSSLERRIRKRMREVGIERYEDYQDHLEVTPDEYTELFNTILINVTGFYRDKPAWDYLSTEVVPQILAAAGDSDPIRAWVRRVRHGRGGLHHRHGPRRGARG